MMAGLLGARCRSLSCAARCHEALNASVHAGGDVAGCLRRHACACVHVQAVGRGGGEEVVEVDAGAEPYIFTAHFAGWDERPRS